MSELKKQISQEFIAYLENLYVYERESYIELSMITIKKEYRNQGYASLVMKKLCDYADAVQKPILMSPEVPEGESDCLNYKQLLDFYEKFGFVPNKGKIRDYSMASHSYKRMPQ